MHRFIQEELGKMTDLLAAIRQDKDLLIRINLIANACINALRQGAKIIFAGNGGSAADSQRLASELVGRLRYNRPSLAALSLTTDTSALTAIGNDYSFETLFSRQVEALGRPGDVLVVLSTSGKSPNVLKALDVAKERQLTTIGFTGADDSLMARRCDHLLNVPSRDTPKIQECHILLGHIVLAIIEDAFFGAVYDPLRAQQDAVA